MILRWGMAILLAMFLSAPTPSHPLRVDTHGQVFSGPVADVLVSVWILRRPQNRWVEWTWDDGHEAGSDRRSVDGANSPAVIDSWLRDLPRGHYVVVAELGTTRHTAKVTTEFVIQ